MAEHEMFPSNSSRSRETKLATRQNQDREHVNGVAKRIEEPKQETGVQKFVHLFLAEDVNDIGDYLLRWSLQKTFWLLEPVRSQ